MLLAKAYDGADHSRPTGAATDHDSLDSKQGFGDRAPEKDIASEKESLGSKGITAGKRRLCNNETSLKLSGEFTGYILREIHEKNQKRR